MNGVVKGNVLQIQSFSVNDGEGIRSVIFLSGCPLRCKWCANPETWTLPPKLAAYRASCTQCGLCKHACPKGFFPAKAVPAQGCIACGSCAKACPNHGLKVLISEMTVDAVVKKVMRDLPFFQSSGGGVTFSGGEATAQEHFSRALAEEFDDRCIDMWIETCGYFNWESVRDIFSRLSHVLYDIKCMDSETHKAYTGVDNRLILENVCHIYDAGIPITIRIPVVPGVSGTIRNMKKTAEFITANLVGADIELLPYHDLGTEKYNALGMTEHLNCFSTPSMELIAEYEDIFRQKGIEVVRFR